ncbi:MAG: alpha/beta hydrolase [Bryobacteraceae bacterium]
MPARPVLLAVAFFLASCANLRQSQAIDRLQPCKHVDGPTDGYCGTLDVWEDRDAGSGRKIALKIIVFPALKRKAAPDPLFFLAGGPGQGAAEIAGLGRELVRRVGADRDLVFVDQRGTGKSNPLECKPDGDDDDEDESRALERLRACLEKLKQKADLTKYTTTIAMDDLDQVRQHLGYGKINLYGGSYGTRAALVYARRHTAYTRAVILDGVAPTDMRLPLYMARDGQRALDLLFRDCTADKGCNERFPRLRERLNALLGARPRKVPYVHPRTGVEKEGDVKRLTLGGILFASLYSPKTASLVPLLIEQAEKGVFTGFFALGAAFDPSASSIARGMHFSVVCSEDAPRIQPGSIERETAATFLGAEMADLRLKVCQFWPRGKVEADYFINAPSELPALILSGELDPVTPPSWGQQIASQWKNARHITVPATGHGAAGSGCVPKLMAQFLNDGSAANLNPSCVDQVKRPPFVLGPAGPDPLK